MLKLASPLPAGSLLVFFNQKGRRLKKGEERCHFTFFLPFPINMNMGFSGGSDGKESTFNAGDLHLILGLGRSPGGRHGNPLQYPCLENPHGGGLQSIG